MQPSQAIFRADNHRKQMASEAELDPGSEM